MADDFYSKKRIGERIRIRLQPPPSNNAKASLLEALRKAKHERRSTIR